MKAAAGIAWDFFVVPRLGGHAPTQALVNDRFARGVAAGVFEAIENGQPDPDSEVLLAATGPAAVLGFATFYEIQGGWLWLHLLWVEEAWRRRGIAGDLLQHMAAIADARGLKGVQLGRTEGNAAMARLLAREGWAVDHIVHFKKIEGA